MSARPELVDGPLDSAAAASQGKSAAPLIALACLGTAARLRARDEVRSRDPPAARRRVRRGLAVAGVVAVIAAVVAVDPGERFDRFKQRARRSPATSHRGFTESHLLSGGGSGRWQFWSAAVDEYREAARWSGGAPARTRPGGRARLLQLLHPRRALLYVETLGELGLVGLALLVAALGGGLAVAFAGLIRQPKSMRALTAALMATFVAFLFAAAIDWVWELPAVTAIGFLCLGLLCGAATAPERTAAAGAERAGRTRAWPSRTCARPSLPAAWRSSVAQAIPLLAQREIRTSQKAAARGDGKAALDAAQSARGLQGWAASPHLQIALVEEQMGDLPAARRSVADAIERDGSDWRSWLVSARLEAKSGSRAAARARGSARRAGLTRGHRSWPLLERRPETDNHLESSP